MSNTGTIVVVGLGPGSARHLTREAESILAQTDVLYARTKRHPVVSELPAALRVVSFDHFYESKPTFGEVYSSIVDELLSAVRSASRVVYAVPGHPLMAEDSVSLLLSRAEQEGVAVEVIAGLSFLEPVVTALGIDPLSQGLQVMDALAVAAWGETRNLDLIPSAQLYQPADMHHPAHLLRRVIAPETPMLLCQVFNSRLASSLKLALLEVYPPEHMVSLVQNAGVQDLETVTKLPLYEIDRREVNHLTTLYVPALTPEENISSLESLRAIVARLRGPSGCPWDREQTPQTLKPYIVEEAYEVLEALDDGNTEDIIEELGDLLLQVVLQAQLATESDSFSLEDVIKSIGTKLIRRHPHVFGEVVVSGSKDVLRNWDQIKRAEKVGKPSAVAGVTKGLPALAFAQSVQKRAARAGFDWPKVDGVMDKIREEIEEFKEANDQAEREAELGDVLFSLVNLARWLNLDAEECLRQANARFQRRFQQMEDMAEAKGEDLTQLPLDAQEELWQQAKMMGS